MVGKIKKTAPEFRRPGKHVRNYMSPWHFTLFLPLFFAKYMCASDNRHKSCADFDPAQTESQPVTPALMVIFNGWDSPTSMDSV